MGDGTASRGPSKEREELQRHGQVWLTRVSMKLDVQYPMLALLVSLTKLFNMRTNDCEIGFWDVFWLCKSVVLVRWIVHYDNSRSPTRGNLWRPELEIFVFHLHL